MSDNLQVALKIPLAKNFNIRTLLKFAAPTMIMMVFMGLYTIGDTIIIAQLVNTDALSALNIVTPIINIIVGLGGVCLLAVVARWSQRKWAKVIQSAPRRILR